MSQSKRNNIIFYSILSLVVVLSILGTFFAIKYHNINVNKNKVTNTSNEEKITPYLTFKEVSESKTIDVFKSYPINPIKINHESNNKITISGLKNKEVQNKVNEKLSVIDDEKTKDGESLCYLHFNVSNVLSVSCNGGKVVSLNLVNGEEITLEDIFNKNSDIYSILIKSNYDNLCSWAGCYPDMEENEEWPSIVENKVVENLKHIRNNDFELTLFDTSVRLEYDENEDFSGTFINFYDFSNEVTIYDRFLDDSIYENKIIEYCEPGSCSYKINNDTKTIFNGGEYLNDKTYLSYQINNYTDHDAIYDYKVKEEANLDLESISKKLKEEIIKNEHLNLKGNNYVEYDISIQLYYHTENDFQIIYDLIKREFNKENFIKYRLNFNEAKTISTKVINKVNMLLDKNNNISYLSNNPTKDIPNFESKIYDYILNDIKTNENSAFTGYNACEFADDFDICEEEKDYHNLIKEASFAVDTVNNRLHMYEFKPGIAMAESYVNTFISLDIFKDKIEQDNNQENIENPNESNNENINDNPNEQNTNETD